MAKKLSPDFFQKKRQQNLDQSVAGVSLQAPALEVPVVNSTGDSVVNSTGNSVVNSSEGLTNPSQMYSISQITEMSHKKDCQAGLRKLGIEDIYENSERKNFVVDRYIRYWMAVVINDLRTKGIESSIKDLASEAIVIYINNHYIVSERGACQLKNTSVNDTISSLIKSNPVLAQKYSWAPIRDRQCSAATELNDKLNNICEQIKYKYSYSKKNFIYDAIVELLNTYFLDLKPSY